MRGKPVTAREITEIIRLRKTGHSLNEIRRIVKRGNAVVWEHVKNVQVLPEFQQLLKDKQGASKRRARIAWEEAENKIQKISFDFNKQTRMLIATSLYWAEGTKDNELTLTNSDPALVKTFVRCLEDFGVPRKRLKISIRIYEDLNREKCLNFWADLIGITKNDIVGVDVLVGKKVGKLEYGMCRVRVTKGAPYFKMLKRSIELIKTRLSL